MWQEFWINACLWSKARVVKVDTDFVKNYKKYFYWSL